MVGLLQCRKSTVGKLKQNKTHHFDCTLFPVVILSLFGALGVQRICG